MKAIAASASERSEREIPPDFQVFEIKQDVSSAQPENVGSGRDRGLNAVAFRRQEACLLTGFDMDLACAACSKVLLSFVGPHNKKAYSKAKKASHAEWEYLSSVAAMPIPG